MSLLIRSWHTISVLLSLCVVSIGVALALFQQPEPAQAICLPFTYTVTSTADDGSAGTLRAAIASWS